jgi:hypothetical protein
VSLGITDEKGLKAYEAELNATTGDKQWLKNVMFVHLKHVPTLAGKKLALKHLGNPHLCLTLLRLDQEWCKDGLPPRFWGKIHPTMSINGSVKGGTRVADTVGDFPIPTINHGQWDGCIGIEGMILCEMPEETHREMKDYYAGKSEELNQTIATISGMLRGQEESRSIRIVVLA